MKRLILSVVFLFSHLLYADEINIKVNPTTPVFGETFFVDFNIKTKNGTDPIINFDPQGVEVISRRHTGTSTTRHSPMFL